MAKTRTETDTLGPIELPADALYGAQTGRAIRNFPISGRPVPLPLIYAMVRIKRAAVRVHVDAGRMDASHGEAVAAAAREVLAGQHDDQFPIDVFQTGSGTSSHMNVNEVLARRATQLLADQPDRASLHPNDHLNLGQSSNDVFPSAIHLACGSMVAASLRPALRKLAQRCHNFADQTFDTLKTGRTHLMDAMPIRFGQEFRGYAHQLEAGEASIARAALALDELALGGTAVGTGVNAPEGFATGVCSLLAEEVGRPIRVSERAFQAQASLDAITQLSGTMRGVATSLYKIANDVRWMASGPDAGLAELEIPAVQPGSSIMPAKVNPVICESVLMACAQVFGLDQTVAFANSQAQFELHTMLPLVGSHVLEIGQLLAASALNLEERCLQHARPSARASEIVARNPILATALVPRIGYEAAAALAQEALRSGRALAALAEERTELSREEIERLLDPETLAGNRGREA